MKINSITILLFILLSICEYAQETLNVNYDYSRFRYDSTNSSVEFYIKIEESSLHRIQSNESRSRNLEAKIGVEIKLTGSDSLVYQNNFIISDSVTTSHTAYLQTMIDFILPINDYDFSFVITDSSEPQNIYNFEESISLKSTYLDKLHISDIQLASNIVNDGNANSLFYKNTLEVMPNPSSLYTSDRPVCFFYTELYNNGVNSDTLIIQRQLLNSNGEVIYSAERKVAKFDKDIVNVGAIALKDYPSGQYLLKLAYRNKENTISSFSSKKLFYYNPHFVYDVKTGTDLSTSSIYVMSEEEVDHEFVTAEVIATRNEKEIYESLSNIELKQKFLEEFWKKRDFENISGENHFRIQFLKNVEFVKERYKTSFKTGEKTDRGKIFLKYGKPDEINGFPSQMDMKPYEIWNYNSIEGGVIFVFGDITGYNNYELLHSTKRGEVRDENWIRRLRQVRY